MRRAVGRNQLVQLSSAVSDSQRRHAHEYELKNGLYKVPDRLNESEVIQFSIFLKRGTEYAGATENVPTFQRTCYLFVNQLNTVSAAPWLTFSSAATVASLFSYFNINRKQKVFSQILEKLRQPSGASITSTVDALLNLYEENWEVVGTLFSHVVRNFNQIPQDMASLSKGIKAVMNCSVSHPEAAALLTSSDLERMFQFAVDLGKDVPVETTSIGVEPFLVFLEMARLPKFDQLWEALQTPRLDKLRIAISLLSIRHLSVKVAQMKTYHVNRFMLAVVPIAYSPILDTQKTSSIISASLERMTDKCNLAIANDMAEFLMAVNAAVEKCWDGVRAGTIEGSEAIEVEAEREMSYNYIYRRYLLFSLRKRCAVRNASQVKVHTTVKSKLNITIETLNKLLESLRSSNQYFFSSLLWAHGAFADKRFNRESPSPNCCRYADHHALPLLAHEGRVFSQGHLTSLADTHRHLDLKTMTYNVSGNVTPRVGDVCFGTKEVLRFSWEHNNMEDALAALEAQALSDWSVGNRRFFTLVTFACAILGAGVPPSIPQQVVSQCDPANVLGALLLKQSENFPAQPLPSVSSTEKVSEILMRMYMVTQNEIAQKVHEPEEANILNKLIEAATVYINAPGISFARLNNNSFVQVAVECVRERSLGLTNLRKSILMDVPDRLRMMSDQRLGEAIQQLMPSYARFAGRLTVADDLANQIVGAFVVEAESRVSMAVEKKYFSFQRHLPLCRIVGIRTKISESSNPQTFTEVDGEELIENLLQTYIHQISAQCQSLRILASVAEEIDGLCARLDPDSAAAYRSQLTKKILATLPAAAKNAKSPGEYLRLIRAFCEPPSLTDEEDSARVFDASGTHSPALAQLISFFESAKNDMQVPDIEYIPWMLFIEITRGLPHNLRSKFLVEFQDYLAASLRFQSTIPELENNLVFGLETISKFCPQILLKAARSTGYYLLSNYSNVKVLAGSMNLLNKGRTSIMVANMVQAVTVKLPNMTYQDMKAVFEASAMAGMPTWKLTGALLLHRQAYTFVSCVKLPKGEQLPPLDPVAYESWLETNSDPTSPGMRKLLAYTLEDVEGASLPTLPSEPTERACERFKQQVLATDAYSNALSAEFGNGMSPDVVMALAKSVMVHSDLEVNLFYPMRVFEESIKECLESSNGRLAADYVEFCQPLEDQTQTIAAPHVVDPTSLKRGVRGLQWKGALFNLAVAGEEFVAATRKLCGHNAMSFCELVLKLTEEIMKSSPVGVIELTAQSERPTASSIKVRRDELIASSSASSLQAWEHKNAPYIRRSGATLEVKTGYFVPPRVLRVVSTAKLANLGTPLLQSSVFLPLWRQQALTELTTTSNFLLKGEGAVPFTRLQLDTLCEACFELLPAAGAEKILSEVGSAWSTRSNHQTFVVTGVHKVLKDARYLGAPWHTTLMGAVAQHLAHLNENAFHGSTPDLEATLGVLEMSEHLRTAESQKLFQGRLFGRVADVLPSMTGQQLIGAIRFLEGHPEVFSREIRLVMTRAPNYLLNDLNECNSGTLVYLCKLLIRNNLIASTTFQTIKRMVAKPLEKPDIGAVAEDKSEEVVLETSANGDVVTSAEGVEPWIPAGFPDPYGVIHRVMQEKKSTLAKLEALPQPEA